MSANPNYPTFLDLEPWLLGAFDFETPLPGSKSLTLRDCAIAALADGASTIRYPGEADDYWRMTPNCLRRMMEPYAARLTGYQGYHKFPHTVMGLGVKGPAPADFAAKADELVMTYRAWLRSAEKDRPLAQKVRQGLARVYRSKGERYHMSAYYSADFTLDLTPMPLAHAG